MRKQISSQYLRTADAKLAKPRIKLDLKFILLHQMKKKIQQALTEKIM